MRTQSSFIPKILEQVKEKVIIRDLLIVQDSTRLVPGDFHRYNIARESNEALVLRMVAHISKVAEYASKLHWEDNFLADQRTMKSGCLNSVTRLSFNEFYFYPYHSRKCPMTGEQLGPLDEQSFDLLTQAVLELAAGLPENLHLTLASFPVKDKKNYQYNRVLYVQCGRSPIIDTLTKMSYGEADPEYPGLKLHSLFKGDESEVEVSEMLSASFDAKTNHMPGFVYNRPIHCRTAGGAQFWTLIDICSDHFRGVAKYAFEQQIKAMRAALRKAIPESLSYVLTSNYIVALEEKNALTSTVVHADGVSPNLYSLGAKDKWLGHKKTTVECLDQRQYSTLSYPPREMDLAPRQLLQAIRQHNKTLQVFQQRLFSSYFSLFKVPKEKPQIMPKSIAESIKGQKEMNEGDAPRSKFIAKL